MITSDEFLQAVLADLRVGVESYRRDRKLPGNTEMNEGEFLHATGRTLQTMILEGMPPLQAVLTMPVAIYRIIQLEDALEDAAEAVHTFAGHGGEFETCRAVTCVERQGIINQGRE